MKKVDAIDVLISLKDIISILDSKFNDRFNGDVIEDAIERVQGRIVESNVAKVKSFVYGKVAKVSFHYARYIPEPKYIPNSTIELYALVIAAIFNNLNLPNGVIIYDSIEEAKIQSMLDGIKNLFEMPTKAVNRLQFWKQESIWAPISLYSPMTFAQVKELLKKI